MTPDLNTSSFNAVLFDLDGTLLDTAPDLVAALNHVMVQEGMASVPVSDFRQYVSQGALGLIRAAMPDKGPDVEASRREQFLRFYQAHSMVDSVLFPGIEALLDSLQGRGVPWGIVTNKPEFLTIPIVRQLGWSQRAACVVCGDTLPTNKPDPAPVLLGCELLGTMPEQTLMVGDDPRDLDAGDAAGAASVLVSYGYGAQVVLNSARDLTYVVDKPGQILDLLGFSS